MPGYVLTVVTSSKTNNHFYSAHETEEAAKTEQVELLKKLNDVFNSARTPFVQIGNATIKLAEIESTSVTLEDEAPGYKINVGFA